MQGSFSSPLWVSAVIVTGKFLGRNRCINILIFNRLYFVIDSCYLFGIGAAVQNAKG